MASVYGEYQRRLRAANALDFDDLIGETVAVLRAFPQIAQHYRRRFRHVLVDEYQDTNHAQYVLVRELVGRGGTEAPASSDDVPPAELCVVGDADQSIYAFRGATIRNIEDFERDYPDATTILLEQNYRSTQNILSAANSVIARNSGRRDKRLWTAEGAGELIVGYVADNEHDEARFVAEEIDALADKGEITYNDVAVFYRTNNSSRSLEEVFIRAGIPYKVVGGVRFYERKEIRDIVAYLRVLDNPGDAVSMRRILNTPRRGIGDRAEACVAVYAENTGASFADALVAAAEGKVPMLNSRAEKAIAGFVELLDELRGRLDDDLGISSSRCSNALGTAGSWNPPAIPRNWRGWTTSTNSSVSHTNSAPTGRTPTRWTSRCTRPKTRTCRIPVCWRSSWKGCRWFPTATKSSRTAPAWSR